MIECQNHGHTVTRNEALGGDKRSDKQSNRTQWEGVTLELFRRALPRRIALAAFGIVACTVLIVASAAVRDPVNEFFVALAATVLAAAVAPLVVTVRRRLLRRELAGFFGSELVWKELNLVYPEFVVHDDVMQLLARDNQPLMYDKPDTSAYHQARHIDVERIVASNDIEALLEVASMFKDVDEDISTFATDGRAFEKCELSFISFGLTSNDCTFMYLDKHREKKLFEIIELSGGEVSLRLADSREFRNTADADCSVIVRYAPEKDVSGRRWFLVAGLGPRGTPAAARFLVKNWRVLRKTVGDEKNFCVVVQTSVANIKLVRGHVIYAP